MQQEGLLNGCFKKYRKIGEGSSGKVYFAERMHKSSNENINSNNQLNEVNLKSGRTFSALKKLKLGNSKMVGPLKQYVLMQQFSHPNLVNVEQHFIVTKPYTQKHYLVMEYLLPIMELFTLKELKITDLQIKSIMWQCVNAIQYLHHNHYIHRDIKPSNMLLSKEGQIKLCDFSITTQFREQMTGNTTTRFYRAPQLIFGHKKYSYEVDIWSLGCSFAQLLLHEPLFQGSTDINQLQKIFSVLGYPNQVWPEAEHSNYPYYLEFETREHTTLKAILPTSDPKLLDLITNLLTLNPSKRPTIDQVKLHPYFSNMTSNEGQELKKVASYAYQKKVKQLLK